MAELVEATEIASADLKGPFDASTGLSAGKLRDRRSRHAKLPMPVEPPAVGTS